jgi:hypothetical protein
MMPCNICSPVDEHGLRQPFNAAGKILKGLKQEGKPNIRLMGCTMNGYIFARIVALNGK